ncbi:growth-regulating factor 3-like [Juglans microcarpa x Juglans regia]|uniref:growth-regulating factor 3-like n=1 Tax=Juglans microcarpa x Juglans regia TaxID=2249226 RepID=UPI001B7EF10F|nr:growth-regulating factor 3-like [Juglans microcarpa x Juglans regia]
MDFHPKELRNQPESDKQPYAKVPKPFLEPHQQQPQPSGTALPLFAPEPNNKISSLSAFPDSALAATRFPGMGSYFSLAQWQELELQALIFRYMLAGAAVPPELLQAIKKSLLHTPYSLHYSLQHYPHFQPAMLQSGYRGRAALDPEPGRCRRTDGKKWRCSRDVVAGQKYCERHAHRGRNRSRKPVEIPTSITTANSATEAFSGGETLKLKATTPIAALPLETVAGAIHFALSGPSPSSIDLLQFNPRFAGSKTDNKGLFEAQNEESADGKSDRHILRPFFDDWPRSLRQYDNAGSNASPVNSATGLSISTPGNSSSDVSLKLSTGVLEEPGSRDGNAEPEQVHMDWASAGWATNHVTFMGGPLAEAFRSSTSNSLTTSVLHPLPRVSAPQASVVGT